MAHEEGGCCEAGTRPGPEGECLPAGIAPEQCAEGFAPDGAQGCEPILPASECDGATVALPGETECHELAPCGTTTWGAIPTEADTEFVDGAYAGGDSDGSEARPWTRIPDGISAAAAGAIVAVAAGSYPDQVVIMGKAVRLWGRCPAMVELTSADVANPALMIQAGAGGGADGSEVRDLAIQSAYVGVLVSGSVDVLLDRVWLHDTGGLTPLGLIDDLGETSVTLDRSLVERAEGFGVMSAGASLTVRNTVLRDMRCDASGTLGRCLHGQPSYNTARRAVLLVEGSVLERCRDVGIAVFGSDATVDRTVVRDTLPSDAGGGGRGIHVGDSDDPVGRSNVIVRNSVIERSREIGIQVFASDLLLETTVVRETQVGVAPDSQGGLSIWSGMDPGTVAAATVRSSVFASNEDYGLYNGGADLLLESTVVRDTTVALLDTPLGVHARAISEILLPAELDVRFSLLEHNRGLGLFYAGSHGLIEGTRVQDTTTDRTGRFGRGLGVQPFPEGGPGPTVAVRGSVFEGQTDTAIFIAGSTLTVHGSVLRDSAGDEFGQYGSGLMIQDDLFAVPSSAAVHDSVVADHHWSAVGTFGSTVVLERTVVRNTQPRVADDLFGDAVVVVSRVGVPAALSIDGCLVQQSARVGIASFGADIQLAHTTLDCNTVDLNGEHSYRMSDGMVDLPFNLDDQGGNRCGCGQVERACIVQSGAVEVPGPVAPNVPSEIEPP